MAEWYELNLHFTKCGNLLGLKDFLSENDKDAPVKFILDTGTDPRTDHDPVLWRSPSFQSLGYRTPKPADLTEILERFGFEGEGWFCAARDEEEASVPVPVNTMFMFGPNKWVFETPTKAVHTTVGEYNITITVAFEKIAQRGHITVKHIDMQSPESFGDLTHSEIPVWVIQRILSASVGV